MTEQNKLYMAIQQYSFVIYETALYLDTHPTCRQALEHYAQYSRKLREAAEEYEKKYGPLTIFGGDCAESWQWVSEPWPWEYSCR